MRAETMTDALVECVRQAAPLPRWITASLALRLTDAPAHTLRIERSHVRVEPRDIPAPDTVIDTDQDTLAGIAVGRASGIAAFLDGSLRVRGNLALSLRMAGMWRGSDRPESFARARDVEVDGVRTFFLEAGRGPTVVLLHGLGATNASMLPTFADLVRDHHVLAPDLPGFGATSKPLRPLHAAYFARWLRGFLDAVGVDRAHLVGNSMGGRVAIEAGLRHPERVDRLALLAPSPAFLRGRELVRVVRLLRPELALLPLPIRHPAVVAGIQRMFARPERLPRPWYDAAADEFLRVFRTARGRICFFSAARQIYLEEPFGGVGGFWRRLPELSPPALFIWGDRDRLVPAGFARHVERLLPEARSVVLRSCGHVPQFERPADAHGLIREHLGAPVGG